ncbi:unnamed protein product [Ectocarpus sp. 12 AP-2014]
MSRPLLAEPPAKRQRAQGEGDRNADWPGLAEEDQEFQRLEAVSNVQDELNALEEEEAQQVLLVHKAFLKRKRPLYIKRQEAIAQVPDFWLKVLLAHPLTQPYISDGDQLALSYLEAVAVHKATSTAAAVAASGAASGAADGDKGRKSGASEEEKEEVSESVGGEGEKLDDDDDVGFRVTFTFRENPFFSNSELWREWEPADEKAAFSVVKWKDTDESRDLQSCLLWNLDPALQEETPSFFSIFGDDMEDYELGEALRGDITDNPLDIYMRHDFDAEAPEEEEEGGAAAQPEGEEEGGEYDGGVNQIGAGLEEGGGETIVDEG